MTTRLKTSDHERTNRSRKIVVRTKAWSLQRRAAAAARIRAHRPWRHSTGPRSAAGKAASSQNARRHGWRSATARHAYAVLARHAAWLRRVIILHKLTGFSQPPLFTRPNSANLTSRQPTFEARANVSHPSP